LWWQYLDSYDEDALNLLLQYNKEDVVNLKLLREKLAGLKNCQNYQDEYITDAGVI